MPEKNKTVYAGAGALTGLAIALLLRKLTAPKRGANWKDYATWGAAGAAAGGLTGYGLATPPVDKSEYSNEQQQQLKDNIKHLEDSLSEMRADRSKYAPGLVQALWAPIAGLVSGVYSNRMLGFSEASKKFTESLAKIKEDGAKAIGKAQADLAAATNASEITKATRKLDAALANLAETKKALKGRWYLDGASRSLKRTGLPLLGLALGSWFNKNEIRDWYRYSDDKLKLFNPDSSVPEEVQEQIRKQVQELAKGGGSL